MRTPAAHRLNEWPMQPVLYWKRGEIGCLVTAACCTHSPQRPCKYRVACFIRATSAFEQQAIVRGNSFRPFAVCTDAGPVFRFNRPFSRRVNGLLESRLREISTAFRTSIGFSARIGYSGVSTVSAVSSSTAFSSTAFSGDSFCAFSSAALSFSTSFLRLSTVRSSA